jgi:hypothetical protein
MSSDSIILPGEASAARLRSLDASYAAANAALARVHSGLSAPGSF